MNARNVDGEANLRDDDGQSQEHISHNDFKLNDLSDIADGRLISLSEMEYGRTQREPLHFVQHNGVDNTSCSSSEMKANRLQFKQNILSPAEIAVIEARNHALRGGFMQPQTNAWKIPSWKLLVFVSSTFTDTKYERDYLMQQLLFELRSEARLHGIDVLFVDMRWGLRDEATLDHRTWDECANAISWCKQESAGVCFLSLQAAKYGYTPLPRVVLKADLDRHLLLTECSEEVRSTVFSWYKEDQNAIEPEYSLRHLNSKNDPLYWNDAFPVMLEALRGMPLDRQRYSDLEVGKSVSEWEVRAALSDYPLSVHDRKIVAAETAVYDGDLQEHVEEGNGCLSALLIWCSKNFLLHDESIDVRLSNAFDDTIDDEWKRRNLVALIEFMKCSFKSPAAYFHAEPLSLADFLQQPDGEISSESCRIAHYMVEYQSFVSSRLPKSLWQIIANKHSWEEDGCGMDIPGDKLAEMLHHAELANKKCETFVGREQLLSQVVDLVLAEHRDPPFEESKFSGISAAVIGVSGAGKTALMAKVASLLFEHEHLRGAADSRPVLIRFCGKKSRQPNSQVADDEFMHAD